MNFVIFIFTLLISFIFVNKILKKIEIINSYKKYLNSIKSLELISYKSASKNNQAIFDNISKSGGILIVKLFLFFLPYLLVYLSYFFLNQDNLSRIIIPSIPYLILFKKFND